MLRNADRNWPSLNSFPGDECESFFSVSSFRRSVIAEFWWVGGGCREGAITWPDGVAQVSLQISLLGACFASRTVSRAFFFFFLKKEQFSSHFVFSLLSAALDKSWTKATRKKKIKPKKMAEIWKVLLNSLETSFRTQWCRKKQKQPVTPSEPVDRTR